jgi:hypothetical protein
LENLRCQTVVADQEMSLCHLLPHRLNSNPVGDYGASPMAQPLLATPEIFREFQQQFQKSFSLLL